MYTLNCKGKLLMLDKPLVMGIINATPDSFYEGHLQKGIPGILLLADNMLAQGADILDIGGQSTKPGSERIDANKELGRVIPVIEAVIKKHPGAIISIDTYHSKVATEAVHAGASMVNDISAGDMDAAMLAAAAALKVPYVCMHMQGSPESMQQNPQYKNVVQSVVDFFIKKTSECMEAGIQDVIIDPGFGFGKTIQHNFQLLRNLAVFKMLNRPLLAGISRKSTIYKTLGIAAGEALNGTTALNTMALMNGANILRVHDVKEAKEAVTLFEAYSKV
jgi:dihydropteroate synthase